MARKSNAKPAVDSADENMNVEMEEVMEMEEVKKPVAKEVPLSNDDIIEVVSLVSNVSYKDKKYGDMYKWENVGDVVDMTFEVISNMHQNHKAYFKNMWLKPLDNRVVKKFALESTYRDYDYLMDASNYTRKNISDICESIRKTPMALKYTICNKIKSLVSSGEVTDVAVLREIEKRLNIDLIHLIA